MVKIKVTTLTEVIFYLKIEVPYFKKKQKKPYYRFWKIRKYKFLISILGNKS